VTTQKNYDFVPAELWSKFPHGWILMLKKSTRIALESSLLALSFMVLFATLVGPPHRSEWLYLLTAGLGPEVVAVWYIAFPFNPYRSMAAIGEGMRDMDKGDRSVAKLVALLKSSDAHRFLLKTSWKLSLLFFVPMAVISAVMQTAPIWRFGLDCVVRIPAFFFLCLFVLFRMELLAWALQNWKSFDGKSQMSG
jgi:hypothetical protein